MFGIIGDPVEHSLSPLFQARFAEMHGVDAVYVPLPVREEDLSPALEGLRVAGLEGLNVTVPHKERVFQMVRPDADARVIGAVNTLRRSGEGWQGCNTDWQGVRHVFGLLGIDVAAIDVFLIGAGGTARAVLHALADAGARRVFVCNRGQTRLQAFLRHARQAYPDIELTPVAWQAGEAETVIARCPFVLNTTAIGLGDADAVFPFAIDGAGAAMDAVYAPDGRTAFVMAAKRGGRRAVDGLPMLLAQGAASFAWWHGVKAEVAPVMEWMEARLQRTPTGSLS